MCTLLHFVLLIRSIKQNVFSHLFTTVLRRMTNKYLLNELNFFMNFIRVHIRMVPKCTCFYWYCKWFSLLLLLNYENKKKIFLDFIEFLVWILCYFLEGSTSFLRRDSEHVKTVTLAEVPSPVCLAAEKRAGLKLCHGDTEKSSPSNVFLRG